MTMSFRWMVPHLLRRVCTGHRGRTRTLPAWVRHTPATRDDDSRTRRSALPDTAVPPGRRRPEGTSKGGSIWLHMDHG
ncbi:hypothetical protein ACWDVV_43620, partial [Streptomyces tendae]